MEAVALHEFKATAGDELSFSKGAVLKVSYTSTHYRIRIRIESELACSLLSIKEIFNY